MIQILTYAAIVIFILVSIVRVRHWASSPFHLRWEIYPVYHEKGKEYGGSYYEELNWWEKPRNPTLMGTLKYMLAEIFLVRGLWKNQRKLWYASFPFHFGLYLLCAFIVLLLIGAIIEAFGSIVSAASAKELIVLITYLTTITGFAGLIMGLAGATGLLIMRAVVEDLRLYSSFVDYFNLVFFIALFASWLITCITYGQMHDFSLARNYAADLITLRAAGNPGLAFSVSLLLLDLMLIYLPFTYMLHPLAKYFLYHNVKWDDKPNTAGGPLEQKVESALQKPISWSAPHIRGDGRKTWQDVIDEEVE